jgi:hypothetical protein
LADIIQTNIYSSNNLLKMEEIVMTRDYIPGADAAFDMWQRNLINKAEAAAARRERPLERNRERDNTVMERSALAKCGTM